MRIKDKISQNFSKLVVSLSFFLHNYTITGGPLIVQCYLPIHDLLIHYPRRFTVSYLFLKTSNSRINQKKPPNSRIYKKKPTNSRVFLIILQWIGRKIVNFEFTDFKFTENSWSQKNELGGNTVIEKEASKRLMEGIFFSQIVDISLFNTVFRL